MRDVINYLIEANLLLLLFLGAYRLLFFRETQFSLLRYSMVGAIVFSLAFPFIRLATVSEPAIPTVEALIPANWLPEVVISAQTDAAIADTGTNGATTVWRALGWVYFAGVVVSLGAVGFHLVQVLSVLKGAPSCRSGRFTIVESNGDLPSFSFFNVIFIGNSGKLSPEEREQIIRHETAHASRFHSLDMLLVAILRSVFWFNPFINSYRNILVQLHEFEADARAAEHSDADRYCKLLAKTALRSVFSPVASHFNQSLTLKRIEMIRTIKQKMRPWKLLVMGLVVCAAFIAVACQDQISEGEKPIAQDDDVQAKEFASPNGDETVFMVVEQMPEFPGGFDALTTFLQDNIRYPAAAAKKGISGTVYLSMVVNADGSVTDVKVLRGVEESLDAEAERVVSVMPAWQPGRQHGKAVKVRYNIPIRFDLDHQASLNANDIEVDEMEMNIDYKVVNENGRESVQGKVTDAHGNAISAVNVIVKGTSRGTTTDASGNFVIETNESEKELFFSFVGFESKIIQL